MTDTNTLPSSAGMLRNILRHLRRFIVRAAPLAGWLYVVLVAYVLIGVCLYPQWWKRFLLGRGLFDSRFWVVAVEYLVTSAQAREPIGVILSGLAILVVAWVVFMVGRLGPRHILEAIHSPPHSLLWFTTFVLVLVLAALAFVTGTYETPDELHAGLLRTMEQSDKRWESASAFFRPHPPKSGFFLYLDGPKITRTYNVLQKELTLVLQTSTTEATGERKASVDLKTIGGESISKDRVERSVQLAPTVATPERQAQWLINTYNELNLPVDLPPYYLKAETHSYDLKTAIKALSERGVDLTQSQLNQAVIGDASVLETKVSHTNAPLLYEGELRLIANTPMPSAPPVFNVSFETGGGAHVSCTGIGSLSALDDNLHACAYRTGGCTIKGNVLGVVWRVHRSGTGISVDFVPLAIW